MVGKLTHEAVIIPEQKAASQIYNKGYYGTPLSGGALMLELMEAAYLVEVGRLEVAQAGSAIGVDYLISYATTLYPEFEIKYIVYRDFRQRGYVLKLTESADFNVYGRGKTPKDRPKYKLLAFSERAPFAITDIMSYLKDARRSKRKLLIGIVDEEGDLTYYLVRAVQPKSKIAPAELSAKGIGYLLEDRVMVWDPEFASELHSSSFYGKLMGDALQLSLAETTHLLRKANIDVRNVRTNRKVNKSFEKRARRIQPDIELRLSVYENLKDKGLIVKTGFKYGAHFRVYDNDPDKAHSRYLVHSVPHEFISTWAEISRAVRLAHGVKKEMLFAQVTKTKINYVKLARVRP